MNAVKYDSLLFGNGLSIKILNDVSVVGPVERYEFFF